MMNCEPVSNEHIISAFEEPEELDTAQVAMDTTMLGADWLLELPEDLDMCIAQRDFEGAVDLIERGTVGFCFV